MSKYDLNVKRLVMLLLPPKNRQPIITTLLLMITAPIARIYRQFIELRDESEYRVEHNGQIRSLRAVLNDYFDFEQRRIDIVDAVVADGVTVNMRTLTSPLMVPVREDNQELVVWLRGAVGDGAYDFWVVIPADLKDNIDERRLKAIINIYKLAGMRYGINYI